MLCPTEKLVCKNENDKLMTIFWNLIFIFPFLSNCNCNLLRKIYCFRNVEETVVKNNKTDSNRYT